MKRLDTVKYILLMLYVYDKPIKYKDKEDCIRKISSAIPLIRYRRIEKGHTAYYSVGGERGGE